MLTSGDMSSAGLFHTDCFVFALYQYGRPSGALCSVQSGLGCAGACCCCGGGARPFAAPICGGPGYPPGCACCWKPCNIHSAGNLNRFNTDSVGTHLSGGHQGCCSAFRCAPAEGPAETAPVARHAAAAASGRHRAAVACRIPQGAQAAAVAAVAVRRAHQPGDNENASGVSLVPIVTIPSSSQPGRR